MEKVKSPGKFLAVVQESPSYVHLSKEDKPSIMLHLTIENGQGENSGCEITWFGGLSSPKGMQLTQDQLKRCFDWDWDANALSSGQVPFAGMEVEVDVQWDEWNGKRRLKAVWINNPNQEATVHSPQKIASILGALDRQMKAQARGVTAPKQPVLPPKINRAMVKASDPIELQDDDIPF
jgi:hypothetical protein